MEDTASRGGIDDWRRRLTARTKGHAGFIGLNGDLCCRFDYHKEPKKTRHTETETAVDERRLTLTWQSERLTVADHSPVAEKETTDRVRKGRRRKRKKKQEQSRELPTRTQKLPTTNDEAIDYRTYRSRKSKHRQLPMAPAVVVGTFDQTDTNPLNLDQIH